MTEPTHNEPSAKEEYLARRERRLQTRQAGDGTGMPVWLKRTLLWGGSLVVLGLIGWGMVALSGSTPIPTDGGTLTDDVTERDNILGPDTAPVTLVEYSDFQCPACAAFEPIVKQALEDPLLKDKVRFVYRSLPLTNIHKNALLAARAAQAAALQGTFWEMHDKLFEGQRTWSGLSDTAAREVFKGYASAIGLDVDRYLSDIDSGDVKDRVDEQSDSAIRANVNSTPSFFVNGTRIPQPRSYEEFRQFLIDAANANP